MAKKTISYTPIVIILIVAVAVVAIFSINSYNKNVAGHAILADISKFAAGDDAIIQADIGDLEYNGFQLGIVADTNEDCKDTDGLNEFTAKTTKAVKRISDDITNVPNIDIDLAMSADDYCINGNTLEEFACAKDLPTDVIRSGTGSLPQYDPAVHGNMILLFTKECENGCQDGACLRK